MFTAREIKRVGQHPQQRVCDAEIPPVSCNGFSVVEQGRQLEPQVVSPGEGSGDGTDPRKALRRDNSPDMGSPEGRGGGNGQESQGGAATPGQPSESPEDIATPEESSPLDTVTTDDQSAEGSSD